ncbi:MAG: hypothetical protein KDC69_09000, partial [Flavobacteriaceae bacterium]|nr:hypothetical protein [Flavobacteriaceae bacterium]
FNEKIMTGLRTMWGVSLNEIEVRFGGQAKAELLKNAQKFIDQGLLVIETPGIAGKQSLIMGQVASSLVLDTFLQKTRTDAISDNRVLKVTSQGQFLSDGIASELFMID